MQKAQKHKAPKLIQFLAFEYQFFDEISFGHFVGFQLNEVTLSIDIPNTDLRAGDIVSAIAVDYMECKFEIYNDDTGEPIATGEFTPGNVVWQQP